jgi:hypothetical protein
MKKIIILSLIMIGCAFEPVPYPYNYGKIYVEINVDSPKESPKPTITPSGEHRILQVIVEGKNYKGYFDDNEILITMPTLYEDSFIQVFEDGEVRATELHAKDLKWIELEWYDDVYQIPVYFNWL